MRVVLDTDVVVAALRSPTGASRALLLALADKRIEVVASVTMMIEYESVLMREQHLVEAAVSAEGMGTIIDGLAALVIPVTPQFLWRPQLRDPNDEMVLDAAVAGQCEAIVTFNRRDFVGVARRFGIDVLLPAEAIRRMV